MSETVAQKRDARARKQEAVAATVTSGPLLMWEFLRAFIWLDRGLQQNMEARGWSPLSRTESQVMLLASVGIVRPIEIARNLGLTRQAINQTLSQLVERKLVELKDDPCDKRCKIVSFAREGEAMRRDAAKVLRALENELARRGGRKELVCLQQMEGWDWDGPPVFDKL